MPEPAVVIGGPLRLLAGAALFAAAIGLVGVGARLDWGLGAMVWALAICLVPAAAALARRRELRRSGAALELVDGRLFRRCYVVATAGAELEVLPAGGAWAVVLHLPGGRALPLATWIGGAVAGRIAALLPELPRRAPRAPAGDR